MKTKNSAYNYSRETVRERQKRRRGGGNVAGLGVLSFVVGSLLLKTRGHRVRIFIQVFGPMAKEEDGGVDLASRLRPRKGVGELRNGEGTASIERV